MADQLLWHVSGVLVALLAVACEPKLVVGNWACPGAAGAGGSADAASMTVPVAIPWSNGFEDGFCGYRRVGGFCYAFDDASYELVSAPVHSGERAAAFRIAPAPPNGAQARCVRQGELPGAAYYGAWYFVEAAATDLDNWNLFHFQGGDGGGSPYHGLWDVTITTDDDGSLRLSIYDSLRSTWHHGTVPPGVPIGTWFHIQLYLERAADATGKLRLYQDGQLSVELDGLVTDDSNFAQWYVGNLARGLTPPDSTIYVDDVSIGESLVLSTSR